MLQTVNPQTDKNKDLKPKVLNNAGDLFNEMYYIYKDKYNEEKNGLNPKKTKKALLQKIETKPIDDHQYEYEEEENSDEKNPLKNLIKKSLLQKIETYSWLSVRVWTRRKSWWKKPLKKLGGYSENQH